MNELTEFLHESVRLIGQIEDEITERSTLAEKLKADIEISKQLAQLKQEEVEAVAQALRGEIQREGRKSFVYSTLVNAGFFCLGLLTPRIVLAIRGWLSRRKNRT